MPVKPENRGRYPADWKAIVARIRERSGNCCEGTPMFPDCRIPNGAFKVKSTGEWTLNEDEAFAISELGDVVRVVLTTAHMDHVPEHCEDSNLRHLCQRCHLAWDHEHHQRNARATRRGRRALGDLFE